MADSFHFCVFHRVLVLPKQAMTAIERRHGRSRIVAAFQNRGLKLRV